VLRRIFGPKREEVAGGWRSLHNEELHNSYASPIIRAIKSRKMNLVGRVERMGEMRNSPKILRDNSKGISIDGRITLV